MKLLSIKLKLRWRQLKAENADYIKACKSKVYCAIIDMIDNRIGISVQNKVIYFPDIFDKWHHKESDEEGIYWLPRKGNEELEYQLLQLENTQVKPNQDVVYDLNIASSSETESL